MLGLNSSPHCIRAMNRSLVVSTVLLALAGAAEVSVAQNARAQHELRRGIEAAARGDTLGALAYIDNAIALDPRYAEAYFQRGQLYAALASSSAFDYEDRVKALDAFEQALRYDPSNPLYMLELGKLKLKQQIRLDAARLFNRALEEAARADASTLAEVHFQLGLFRETQWLRFRYRHVLPIWTPQLSADEAFYNAEYVWRMLDESRYPGDAQGLAEREAMLKHFRAALEADPGHIGANKHLLAYLIDEGLMSEYMEVARNFVRAAPSRPEAFFALGLGHHREGRVEEAAGAFEVALSLMDEDERRAVEDLSRILPRDMEELYGELTPEARMEFQRRFWTQADPLFLTSTNEFWTEYMARMVYADMRFGVEEYGLRGWDTDRGVIYVRYGEPLRKATFSAAVTAPGDPFGAGRITTVWSYGEKGPVFVFRQNPGYRRATFAGDFKFYAEEYRSIQPAQLSAPSIPERYEVPLQVVRFRGPGGQMDLEVHSSLPLGKLTANTAVETGELEYGLFIQDERAVEIERQTQKAVLEFRSVGRERRESWRVTLDPDRKFLVGVEAREPLTWHAAVGRVQVEPRRFEAGELSVSDVLLADVVEPLTAEPADRTGFRVVANPAMAYTADDPVALYFEIYNLLPDAEQYASYEIELVVTVKELERKGPLISRIVGELADKWGLTAEGTEAVQLRFHKEAHVVARDQIPEYFRFQLPGAPPGRYGLRVTVTDRNAGRSAVAEREFRIIEAGGEGE